MTELAQAAALVLACIFGAAAVAKVRNQEATEASFRGLRLPVPALLAKAVPLVEVVVAVGMVAAPTATTAPAIALLLAFSIVIVRAVASGSTVSCACFGGGAPGGAEDRPVSTLELVRNGGLGALAVVASGAGTGTAFWPSLPAAVIVTIIVATARVAFALVERRRRREPSVVGG